MKAHAWMLTVLFLAAPALATPPPEAGPPPPPREEQMRELRGKLLRQEARLDDAAAVKTEKVLQQFDTERKAAHQREGQSRGALGALVKSDSKDDRAYKDALDALVQAHEGVVKLRIRELDELRKVLGQRDAAKVVVALESIQKAMRREQREGKKAWLRDQLQRMEQDGDDDGDDGPPGPPPGPRGPGNGPPPKGPRPSR